MTPQGPNPTTALVEQAGMRAAVEWGTRVTHVVCDDGAPLGPEVVAAWLAGVPLVTTAWWVPVGACTVPCA